MDASLVPEWFDEFYSYFVFKSASITGQCEVNMNIPDPKMGALHMGP
jgi:hypothetical protein